MLVDAGMASCTVATSPWLRCLFTSVEVRNSTVELRLSAVVASPLRLAAGGKLHLEGGGPICGVAKNWLDGAVDFDDAEDDDEDEGWEDENELVPMSEWVKRKPAGFGVGKAYDLSLEAKLLEEIERDKKAQSAAKTRKKNGDQPDKGAKSKVVEPPPPAGFLVRISNLPKKRNVDKDLWAGLKGVQGLLHIRPLVQGNEKTRDPTCTGIAFLTFAQEKHADRFVTVFNGEPFKFGKVEKKLLLEREKSVQEPAQDTPMSTNGASRLRVRETKNSTSLASPSEYLNQLQQKHAPTEIPTENVEVVEAELRCLEEEIWESLEDEDDYLLDAELAVDDEGVQGFLQNEGTPHPDAEKSKHGCEVKKQVQQGSAPRDVGRVKRSPAVAEVGKAQGTTTSPLAVENLDSEQSDDDDDGEEFADVEIELETWGSETGEDGEVKLVSREVMRTPVRGAESASADKDKKIVELQRMVQTLQSKLKEKTSPKPDLGKKPMTEEEVRQASEARIEALEKRVFWKIKNTRSSTEKSTTKEKQGKKGAKMPPKTKASSPNSHVGNLGSAMRLKKKDRASFSSVLEKYSSSK